MKRVGMFLVCLLPALAALARDQMLPVSGRLPLIEGQLAQGAMRFKFALLDGSGTRTLWSHDGTSSGGSEPRSSLQVFVTNGVYRIALGSPALTNMQPIPPDVLLQEGLTLRVWYATAFWTTFKRMPDQPVGGLGFAATAEKAFDADTLQGKSPEDFEPSGAVAGHEEKLHGGGGGSQPGARLYSQLHALSPHGAIDLRVRVPRDGATLRLWLYGTPSQRHLGLQSLRLQQAELRDQPPETTRVVLEYNGRGWLGGIRESYDFCNTCFKRRSVPETTVLIDGSPWEDWKAQRMAPSETLPLGHVESLVPVGLLPFTRSLKVISRQQGVDDALGSTAVWYYTSSASRAPAAIGLELDGIDLTPALIEAAANQGTALAPLAGALQAWQFDGAWPADAAPSSDALASRVATEQWFESVLSGRRSSQGPVSVLLEGELRLGPGRHRFGLNTDGMGFVDLWHAGDWQRVLLSTEPGVTARGEIELPGEAWYGLRVGASGTEGVGWLIELPDGLELERDLRSPPVLGGPGDAAWSLGPIDLGLIQPVTSGEHLLRLRESAGHGGELQVDLEVE